MNTIITFAISYTILFLIYIILFYIRGLKKKAILKSMQVEFLKIRFQLRNKDLHPKRIGLIITFLDPLIICSTGCIVSLPKWHYIIKIMLGFVLLIGMIYSFYEILGRIIKRKVDRK